MAFGIEGNFFRHVQIGFAINIHMTNPVQVFDDRHPGLAADPFNQSLTATGHDNIDIIRHGYQLTDSRPIRCLHNLYGSFRQTGLFQTITNTGRYRLIGMNCLTTATQNRGVTRLQA